MEPTDEVSRKGSAPGESSQEELNTLRKLLLGSEYERALEGIISQSDTELVAKTLSEAIIQRNQQDHSVTEALSPLIDEVLTRSIRKRPQRIATAIYPVIGPAIRKSVAKALADMVQTLNQVLESSVSFRAWSWRYSAWHAGIPYGEYVLLKTLEYRVEQILLIHRETGILLHSEHAEGIHTEDPELVSSMLAAINDFVADSFTENDSSSLDNIRVGEFILEIETGPAAFLVAAVRGTPQEEVSASLHHALERIHKIFGRQLMDFDGDREPFIAAADLLQPCLITRKKNNTVSRAPWLAIALLVAGFAYAGYTSYREIIDEQRYQYLKRQIADTPGYILVDEHKDGRGYTLDVLRAPGSATPEHIKATLGRLPWPVDIRDRIAPLDLNHYLLPLLPEAMALDSNVALEGKGDVLVVKGSLSGEQLLRLRNSTLIQSLFREVDSSAATLTQGASTQAINLDRWQQLKAAVDATYFLFKTDTTELAAGEEQKLPELLASLNEMRQLADTLNIERWQLYIIGYSDPAGSSTHNQVLSEQRARFVRQLLTSNQIAPETLLSWGVGGSENNLLPRPQQRRVGLQLLHTPITTRARP